MFPIHDDNERIHGRPYLNYSLIGINVIIFIFEVAITGNFSNAGATISFLENYGAVPDNVLSGNMLSIITSMFLHAGIAHLVGNMVFLFVFGDNIEDRFGRIKYLLAYIFWGVAAALIHSLYAVYAGDGQIPAIGASGAISGVLGAYLVMFPRSKIYTIVVAFFITTIRIPAIAFIPFWFIMQIILQLLDPLGGVAYFAHIGGFVAGVGTGYLWKILKDNNVALSKPKGQGRILKHDIRNSNEIYSTPEIIVGSDYYEIIAEMPGLTQSEIMTNYDPNTQNFHIFTTGARKYDMNIKLPDEKVGVRVDYIEYRNGITRIRLAKEF